MYLNFYAATVIEAEFGLPAPGSSRRPRRHKIVASHTARGKRADFGVIFRGVIQEVVSELVYGKTLRNRDAARRRIRRAVIQSSSIVSVLDFMSEVIALIQSDAKREAEPVAQLDVVGRLPDLLAER